ncbi:MAG: DUF3467 domain-containing protein [Paludibacteraceae bacterium]|jgi:hypothetical protein|nr:DUF3467 domain-containing protein [Paludibacteraceae bacterium]MBP5641921.1 DUF3467 domain-containing protein [Paludibacteraceae bacterium]MBQ4390925.1 DUF3467 domain-containing protein [Paludibacteraceae bacterium]
MEEQKLSINVPAEVADGIYSNIAVIAHSPSEFTIDFVAMLPGMKQANVKSRIVLNPQNAKKLLFALQDNVGKYESTFGKIQILGSPAPGSTVPMSFGGGEA